MSIFKKLFDKIKNLKQKKSNSENLLLKDGVKKNSAINFDHGLKKTNNFFVNSLNKIIYKNVIIDDELFRKIEETLLSMDVGNYATNKIVSAIKNEVKFQNIDNPNLIKQIIIDKLFVYYIQDTIVQTNLNLKANETNVILFFGVNGVGKTTTIAKVANFLQKNNLKICLVAGDTFRAGAVEQLDLWAKKLDIKIFKPTKPNQDPASVIYDGVKWASENKFNVVLCDTSGRLQTKTNLMNELKKINNVIKKFNPNQPCESLLVVDATIGQSGLIQAKCFSEVVKVSGIVLTKIDSTSGGGIIFAIKDNFNLPLKFLCFGEKVEDIEMFDLKKFIKVMLKNFSFLEEEE